MRRFGLSRQFDFPVQDHVKLAARDGWLDSKPPTSVAPASLCCAASPRYLVRIGRPVLPCDLAGHTALSMSEDNGRQRWTLHSPEGQVQKVDLQPTLMAHDFPPADGRRRGRPGRGAAALDQKGSPPAAPGRQEQFAISGSVRRRRSPKVKAPRASGDCFWYFASEGLQGIDDDSMVL